MQQSSLNNTKGCPTSEGTLQFYLPQRDDAAHDAPVISRLNGVVAGHGRWGFWKCFHRMRLKGETWNHKRVWRV